ncbi:MAG: thioredoxin [Lachnospiraceae bacterium]|nr:thioredoxin [Lachnospiraceae bacterium]
MIIINTQEQFELEVLKADKPVLVDFYADWCGPCKALAPLIEELDQEAEDYLVAKVNVDDFTEIAQQYRVASIPTVLIFRGGACVERNVGLTSKDELLKLVHGEATV